MFAYYLKLSVFNIRRSPTLYGLVLLTLAIGLGAFIANIAMINTMASDPIPSKSDRLFHVSMNTWPAGTPHTQPFAITRYADSKAILDADVPVRTSVSYQGVAYPRAAESKSLTRFRSTLRATSGDFFEMFNAPFKFGGGFSSEHANDIVLSASMNEQLFAGENSVGQSVDIQDVLYTVVGVLDDWRVRPRFYHPQSGAFSGTEDLYIPLEVALDANIYNTVQTVSSDNYDDMAATREASVYFLQTWVELSSASEREAMQQWLDDYTETLREAGQHPNDILNELHDVNEWLEHEEVVDSRILAFAIATALFLIVCLFNASSLLLARYESNQFETGLKRALGVSQKQLFAQGLVESLIVGVLAGLASIALSWLFLQIAKQFLSNLTNIAVIELNTVVIGLAIAIVTSIVCMAYPLVQAGRQSISSVLKG